MQNKKSVIASGLTNNLGFGSTEFFVLRVRDFQNLNNHFLLHILRTNFVIEKARQSFKGSAGQQRVPKEFILNFKIPLPPLKIQQEIVAFIESKLALITQKEEQKTSLRKTLEEALENLLLA